MNLLTGNWKMELLFQESRREILPKKFEKVTKLGTNTYSKNAAEIREQFTKYFLNEGSVEFQWNRLDNF